MAAPAGRRNADSGMGAAAKGSQRDRHDAADQPRRSGDSSRIAQDPEHAVQRAQQQNLRRAGSHPGSDLVDHIHGRRADHRLHVPFRLSGFVHAPDNHGGGFNLAGAGGRPDRRSGLAVQRQSQRLRRRLRQDAAVVEGSFVPGGDGSCRLRAGPIERPLRH